MDFPWIIDFHNSVGFFRIRRIKCVPQNSVCSDRTQTLRLEKLGSLLFPMLAAHSGLSHSAERQIYD